MKLKNVLEEEIRSEIEDLDGVELGTETAGNKISDAMQMTDRLVKLEQIEIEKQKLEIEQRKLDIEQQKVDDERSDRKTTNRIKIGEIIGGAVLTGGGFFLSYKFEGVATHTSKFGNKAADRLLNFFWKK